MHNRREKLFLLLLRVNNAKRSDDEKTREKITQRRRSNEMHENAQSHRVRRVEMYLRV